MMPEEWPIAALAANPDASARVAGRDRLSTVRADFFLDPAERLTEQERALMTTMLHCLIGDIADQLRAALPHMAVPANDEGNIALAERLNRSGLLDREGLVRLLLRRADEERIATAAKSRSGRPESRVIQALVSHRDGAIAAAAMALIIARGRRRDRFGQCLLHFDDLPPSEAHALACALGAALRADLGAGVPSADADRVLASGIEQVLAGHDPSAGLEMLTASLVRLLTAADELTDALIGNAAVEGDMSFAGHALARRVGIPDAIALEELLSGDPRRLMTLLRINSIQRETVAAILAAVGDLIGIADPPRAMAAFDGLADADIAAAKSRLSADPVYRRALDALGTVHGQRTV